MSQAKPFSISKHLVVEAYKRVKRNNGTYGVDKVSLEEYESNLKNNLYKVWNRMSSGTYYPKEVREVEIPKKNKGVRKLGIPTVEDRVAQMVVQLTIEPEIDKRFHKESYGYRPNKSALEAIGKAKERSWRKNWVVDLDIKSFFDNVEHKLMMKIVREKVKEKWAVLYIKRWLEKSTKAGKGTPQGGVISPLLANMYLDKAFDKWMATKYPHIKFERYCDDIVIHTVSESQSEYIKAKIEERLKEYKLEMNKAKSKIVYCKDGFRRGEYSNTSYEFLGYTFRRRTGIRKRDGKKITVFTPAISKASKKEISKTIRSWRINHWTELSIEEVAIRINPKVRGWINYYGKHYRSELGYIMYILNNYLARWVIKKYKNFKRLQWEKANNWLGRKAKESPRLFAHWGSNFKMLAG